MNIPEFWLRIKASGEGWVGEWGAMALIVLIGLASFGLGRLSATEEARPAVAVRQASEAATARPVQPGGLVVASKKGSAYHYPWCPGASTISEGNKVWFKSEQAARSAGYSPAKNCKGLE